MLIFFEVGIGMFVKILEVMVCGKVIFGMAIVFWGYLVELGVDCLINNNLVIYVGVIEDII